MADEKAEEATGKKLEKSELVKGLEAISAAALELDKCAIELAAVVQKSAEDGAAIGPTLKGKSSEDVEAVVSELIKSAVERGSAANLAFYKAGSGMIRSLDEYKRILEARELEALRMLVGMIG